MKKIAPDAAVDSATVRTLARWASSVATITRTMIWCSVTLGALLLINEGRIVTDADAAEPTEAGQQSATEQNATADTATQTWATRPITIVTLGDSITRGMRSGVTAEQTFAAQLEQQLNAAGTAVRVVNVGIGGERTDQALQRLNRVLEHRPDLVTIMYGTNDSYVDIGKSESRLTAEQYRENLIQLASELLQRGIRPVLMTAPRWSDDANPNGIGENPNLKLEPYVAACRDVARLWRLPLVDHYEHWTQAREQGTNLREWTTDGCHPNPAGHQVLTQTMLAGVKEAIGPRLQFRQKLAQHQPVRVVCFGDSVTGVYYHTGSRRAYTDMLGIALRQIAPQAQVTMINAGISGHTTVNGMARLERDVLSHKPDLVTVMFGLNDMTRVSLDDYRRNLKEIITRCRAIGSEVVLATPNNVIDSEGRPTAKLVEYCDAVRAVGREENVPVCDTYRELDAVRARDAWAWRLLLSDAIHPNMDGHKRIASALAQTITGERVDLTEVPPAQPPLSQVLESLRAGKPVRLLVMPAMEPWIGPLLKEKFPQAELTIESWPIDSQSLAQIEQDAKSRVRALKPDGVLIAIPRSAASPSADAAPGEAASQQALETFANMYAWVMNWSLNFGIPTWDVVVVHPDVWEPLATPAQHDGLIRQLVRAQDLPLIDRPSGDKTPPQELLRHALKLDEAR